MGRWGWRLFEGDQDIDIACDLNIKLGLSDDNSEWTLIWTVIHSDEFAPNLAKAIYQTRDFADVLNEVAIPYLRENLNENNCGNDLFAKCRSLDRDLFWGEYPIIILVP
ncbi:hypothetical protein N7540_010279 [Penicillium herquei]|nr:hypothetical protein N7540_010279 [Penicillium herquei]